MKTSSPIRASLSCSSSWAASWAHRPCSLHEWIWPTKHLASLRGVPRLSTSPRTQVIENEIAFIDSCLANGGCAPGEPPGARGIAASFRTTKGEGQPPLLMLEEGRWRWEVTTVESPRSE